MVVYNNICHKLTLDIKKSERFYTLEAFQIMQRISALYYLYIHKIASILYICLVILIFLCLVDFAL